MSSIAVAYDDPSDPAELTFYATEADRRPTRWITVALEDSVRLETMR